MVFKLLLVILTLLILDTSARTVNRLQIDHYKYGYIKNHGKRQSNNIEPDIKIEEVNTQSSRCEDDKTCNDADNRESMSETKLYNLKDTTKRAWGKLDIMNLLRSLPQEEMFEPVIFVQQEFMGRPEK